MRCSLLIASLLGCVLLAAGNPEVYRVSGIFSTQVLQSTGATFSLYQDMQTFLGASAACQTINSTQLASIVSLQEMETVNRMAVDFWESPAGAAYLSAPTNPAAAPGTPGSLGFMNASLFNGCVWIGMSNLNEPGHETYLANINDTATLAFTDHAPMSDFVANFRYGSSQTPIELTGWQWYGQAPPVRSTGSGYETIAACAMLCPKYNTLQATYNYSPIVIAGCTTIALPYVCKSTPQTNVAPAETPDHHRSRSLKGGGGGAPAGGGDQLYFTQKLAPAGDPHDHGHTVWPVWADLVNTSLPSGTSRNQARCYPGGMYDYCTFPESERHTQADWMYVCWDAGLEPLDINTYAGLVMVMAAQANMTAYPGSNAQVVFTQSFSSSNSPSPINLYTANEFLTEYVAGHAHLPDPNLPTSPGLHLPAFNATGASRQPQPGWPYINTPNTTCGPQGYGMGCAFAVTYSGGKPVGVTTVSANLLANGMCQRPRKDPMPRPDSGAAPAVQLVFRFSFTDKAILTKLRDTHDAAYRDKFLEKLTHHAVPGALPGVSPGDVHLPVGPTTVIAYFTVEGSSTAPAESGGHHKRRGRGLFGGAAPASGAPAEMDPRINEQFGVMVTVDLPYTVNTSSLMKSYLQNIIAHPTDVLAPTFVHDYHIADNSTSFISQYSGMIDGGKDGSDNSKAIAIGLGVGLGVPAFGLLVAGLVWFFKDANKANQAYKKDKGDVSNKGEYKSLEADGEKKGDEEEGEK